MKLSDLDYTLPPDRIAQRPVEPRDAARLMVIDRAVDAPAADHVVTELPGLLRPGDCLVLNRTRVLPAKFVARRSTGGRVEGLFLRAGVPGDWEVLLNGRGRLSRGETLELGQRWTMELVDSGQRGAWQVRVSPRDTPEIVLAEIGSMPLPPYIARKGEVDPALATLDCERYQTVFAERPGAVAAPTAGLHFTSQLLDALRDAGVATAFVTLHVGLGTFQPVEVEDLNDHRMHAEWYELPVETVEACRVTRAAGGRVIAVGTTSVRVLETCAAEDGTLRPGEGWTNILIQPPYEFRAVDGLLTNFHLPRSTLLALVCALAGRERIISAYAAAIARGYRFYSYGDAMLIL